MSIKDLDVCHKLGKEKTQPRVTPLLSLGHLFPSRDPFNKQTIFNTFCQNYCNTVNLRFWKVIRKQDKVDKIEVFPKVKVIF